MTELDEKRLANWINWALHSLDAETVESAAMAFGVTSGELLSRCQSFLKSKGASE